MLGEHVVKTTCTRDCYDACGIAAYTKDGVITKVFYPVFPPDRSAADVVAWIQGCK